MRSSRSELHPITTIVAILLAVLVPGASLAAEQTVPGEILVKFIPKTSGAVIDSLASSVGGKVADTFPGDPDLRLLSLADPNGVPAAIASLSTHAEVRYAEPNYVYHVVVIPNDPSFNVLWGLQNTGQSGGVPGADIDATDAWDLWTGNPTVVEGSIDTGINLTHPDLAGNIWTNPGEVPNNGIDDDNNGYVDDVNGWNFINNSSNPSDDYEHGSHTSGTVGAVGNNSTGVTGVNWAIQMMAVKVCNQYGSCPNSAIIKGIDYATNNHAFVTNNSYGGGGYSQAMYDAISRADAAGSLFVAAAGNNGSNNDASPFYPASYNLPNIIAVAATDRYDNRASFSNYGATSVDLGAPGVDIYSTELGTSYGYLSGTSMATPHVTGVAALLKGYNTTLTHSQVKSLIMDHTRPIGALSGLTVTGGVVNANNSLRAAPAPNPPPGNQAPNANAGGPYRGTTNKAVTFDGSGSSDPDGTISFYSWNFGDGVAQMTSSPTIKHNYTKGGLYSVSLVVYDNYNVQSSPSNTTAKINGK